MARIRTIKPEFFTSEDIVALEPMARLLYIALWCEADREGRMLWKPKTFKLRYFPGDSIDIEPIAECLIQAGLVVLYDDKYAYIPKFSTHQHVNPREAASVLPSPDAHLTDVNVSARVSDASARDSDVQVGKEGEGRERKGKEGETPLQPAVADCPHDSIVALYHEVLPELPAVREWTEKRKAALRSRWRESKDRQSLDWWRSFFLRVKGADFLMGRKVGSNGQAFTCNLEWLLTPGKFINVLEGRYDNRASPAQASRLTTPPAGTEYGSL